MKKNIFVNIVILLTGLNVAAQNGPGEDYEIQIKRGEFSKRQVIPPAPEAADLGKYGNIPVSLYSGTPQISIPFYDIKGGSIGLPISFSYHAGGFKPEDVATWVGLGWTLNAGGVVTRSIMGVPDTYDNYFSANQQTAVNYQDQFAVEQYKQDLKLGIKERQADMFFYNFAGYSGKFMIRQNGEVYTKEKNNLKFLHCIDNCSLGSFIQITDNGGIIYEFREVETSNLEIRDFEGGSGNTLFTYPSSWYLSKITSADGQEEITLSYYSTSSFHKQYTNSFSNKIANYEWVDNSSGGGYFVLSNIASGLPPVNKTYRKYLSNISFNRNGSLVLMADFISVTDQRDDLDNADFPGERMLKSIIITAKDEAMQFKEIKKVNLTQSYFINSVETQNKRLRLDSISDVPSVSTIATPLKPPYVFEYNAADGIPANETPSLDHWGFFNNGADLLFQREPNYNYASQTILNKIKYPTGGYTLFEYEPHQAKNVQGAMMYVGGARIKKITDYSFQNQKATIKNYEYQLPDNTTSGNTFVPEYESQFSFTNYVYDDPVTVEAGTSLKLSRSATAVHGLGSYQGSHIGYTRVTEYLSDLNNNQPLGKTIYEYHHDNFGVTDGDDHMISGTLYKQTVLDNSGKVIQETENLVAASEIMPYMGGSSVGAATSSNNFILCKRPNGEGYAWKLIEAPTPSCVQILTFPQAKLQINGTAFRKQWVRLTEQTQKTYDQLSNTYIINKKKFYYGNTAHTMPTTIEQTTTDNTQVITAKKYAADYTIPSGTLTGAVQGIKTLLDKNIIGAEIENYQYRQNADGTNKKYLGGSITVYDPLLPYPVAANVVETEIPLVAFTPSEVNVSGVFTQDVNYKPAGNLKYTNGQLTEQRKQDDIPVAYIWHYNSMFPVAEITNATHTSVAYTSFEGSPVTGFGNFTFSLNGNIHGFLMGSEASPGITGTRYFSLTAGNIINKTNLTIGNKYIVSYWSQSGVYTIAGVTAGFYRIGKTLRGWVYHEHLVTASATTISITGTGTIDELRLYPEKALMQTYTYKPFIGMSSSCTANNNITYYEYDGYNRLIFARDEEMNIVKNYQYNYNPAQTDVTTAAQTLFYSNELNISFSRNNCPPDASGSTAVFYKVPYGKYASVISVTEATNKAWQDVNTNGQNFANANALCSWANDQRQSASAYVKNDCTPEHGPGLPLAGFIYTVPAGVHTSYISKADANAKADIDIIQNAQNNANISGTCACPYPARKRINGVGPCERGIKVYTSTVYQGGGLWLCTFYYQFSDNSVTGTFNETTTTPCMY